MLLGCGGGAAAGFVKSKHIPNVRAFPLRMLKVVYAKFYHQHTKKAAPSKISNGKIFGIQLQ